MKNNLIQDERSLAKKRKIGSEACNLLLVGLFISLFVKEFVFNVPFSQYTTEIICLFGAFIYIVIRNIIAGNGSYETKGNGKRLVVISSFLSGLALCVIVGIANYARYGEKYTDGKLVLITLIIIFVCGTVSSLLIYPLIYILNQKKQKKIAKELDKEENNI